MLNPDREIYRKELDRHVGLLQALKQELRDRSALDKCRAGFDRLELEAKNLAARLSEQEHKSWDFGKAEFEGAWNAFIEDFALLKTHMMEDQNEEEP